MAGTYVVIINGDISLNRVDSDLVTTCVNLRTGQNEATQCLNCKIIWKYPNSQHKHWVAAVIPNSPFKDCSYLAYPQKNYDF